MIALSPDAPLVVVIDDDPVYLELFRIALHNHYQVFGFANTNIDLDLLQDVSLLVLDLNIPNYDVINFLQAIAAQAPHISLMLISDTGANTLANTRRIAQQLKFQSVKTMAKPLNKVLIQRALKEILDEILSTHGGSHSTQDTSLIKQKEFEEALHSRHFTCFFQPQINIDTGKIYGVEALSRYRRPSQGIISPSRYIEIANSKQFASQFFMQMLECASRKYHEVVAETSLNFRLSVNLSPAALEDPELFEHISHLLFWHQFKRNQLVFEITEQGDTQFSMAALGTVARIQIAGIQVSIDDFGAGSSGLSRLKFLGFDEFKIDKSFVDDVITSSKSQLILENIINMARSMNLRIVVEGVETQGQLAWLQQHFGGLGLIVQGYVYSQPLEAHRLSELLIENQGVFQKIV